MRHYAAHGNAASAAKRATLAQMRAQDLAPIIEEMRAAGAVSLRALAAGLNERGIPAPRGGRWQPAQVARVPAQAEE